MWLSVVTLGVGGIILTFMPDLILELLNIAISDASIIFMQIIGALYFAFGMLNWMSKNSVIGAIYNRPIAVANFTHFMIAGIALIKALISNPGLPTLIWIIGILYTGFGLFFGILLFRHPIKD